jgi:GNAT superfamily N-acetyltransferase
MSTAPGTPVIDPAAIVVRPPATDGEIATFFRLTAAQFIHGAPLDVAAADLQRYVYDAPAADPGGVRGVFHGDLCLGGYLIDERWLHIGTARLRAGCVGVVVAHPEHRGQGIGKALMRDSFDYARARGHTLLMLHGAPAYYQPFGYADVFDATEHDVRRVDVLTHPSSAYQVRTATATDAAAVLDLYDRHFGPHPGSFVHTVDQEAFLLRFSASLDPHAYQQRDGLPFAPTVIAVDVDDRPRGYLAAPWALLRAFGSEIAADDWPATLALLQHHARLLDKLDEPPEQVRWPLPPDSLAAELLGDHFTVQSLRHSRPSANWEASLVDPAALISGMVPAWKERWLLHRVAWSGRLALTIDGVTQVLSISSAGVFLDPVHEEVEEGVSFTGTVALPLLFGFRSLEWAVSQKGQQVPQHLLPVLDVLFPPLTPWIAARDGS